MWPPTSSSRCGRAFRERFAPNPAFERMRELGWLGRKSGTGFYRYFGEKKKENLEVFAELPEELKTKRVSLEMSDAPLLTEARDRMILLMVNEAAAASARVWPAGRRRSTWRWSSAPAGRRTEAARCTTRTAGG